MRYSWIAYKKYEGCNLKYAPGVFTETALYGQPGWLMVGSEIPFSPSQVVEGPPIESPTSLELAVDL